MTVKESLLYEWELLGTGLFSNDTVCPLYGINSVTVPVKVYQEKTNKGLYKISDHALQICCAAFGVTEEEMRKYEGGNWRNADIILDASDPTSVKWELQDYGVCLIQYDGFVDGVTNMYQGAPKNNDENVRKGKYKYGVTVCEKANCLVLAPDDFTGEIATSYDAAAWASAGIVCAS